MFEQENVMAKAKKETKVKKQHIYKVTTTAKDGEEDHVKVDYVRAKTKAGAEKIIRDKLDAERTITAAVATQDDLLALTTIEVVG